MTTETIDVTGLPAPVVNQLRGLVQTLRGHTDPVASPEQPAEWERMQAEVAARTAAHPRHLMTSEERIAALHRLITEHAVPGVVIDDSRESFYEGRE